MNDTNKKIFAALIQNIDLIRRIGIESISIKDLEKEYGSHLSDDLKNVLISYGNEYKVDFKIIRDVLSDFLGNDIISAILNPDALREHVNANMPDYSFSHLSDVQSKENKQSYKFLYENLKENHNSLTEEFHSQRIQLENVQRELAVKNVELKNISKRDDDIDGVMNNLTEFIGALLHNDINISNCTAVTSDGEKITTPSDYYKPVSSEELSLNPGSYNFLRPSFFTEIKSELNKKEIARKNIKKTSPILAKKIFGIFRTQKKTSETDTVSSPDLDKYDRSRRDAIVDLLNDDFISNEERYLKYILLSPGLSRDYIKTLDGAAELGLSSRLVIKLLEQPRESFNKEIIENYISHAHKSFEYNLKSRNMASTSTTTTTNTTKNSSSETTKKKEKEKDKKDKDDEELDGSTAKIDTVSEPAPVLPDPMASGTLVAAENSQKKLGTTSEISMFSDSQINSMPPGQYAQGKVIKFTESNPVVKISDSNGKGINDISEESLNNIYKIFQYYANHIEDLGNMGSDDVVNAAADETKSVILKVVAAGDILPNQHQEAAFANQQSAKLETSFPGIVNGALYLMVHERADNPGQYELCLTTASDDNLSMNVSSLSPVGIAKVEIKDAAATADGTLTDAEAEPMAAPANQNKRSGLGIILIVLLFLVLIVTGAFILITKLKREGRLPEFLSGVFAEE